MIESTNASSPTAGEPASASSPFFGWASPHVLVRVRTSNKYLSGVGNSVTKGGVDYQALARKCVFANLAQEGCEAALDQRDRETFHFRLSLLLYN